MSLMYGSAIQCLLNFFIDRSSQTLHYRDYPLHIVRGEGQYFFDEHGQKYLDTTNNVACGKSKWCFVL